MFEIVDEVEAKDCFRCRKALLIATHSSYDNVSTTVPTVWPSDCVFHVLSFSTMALYIMLQMDRPLMRRPFVKLKRLDMSKLVCLFHITEHIVRCSMSPRLVSMARVSEVKLFKGPCIDKSQLVVSFLQRNEFRWSFKWKMLSFVYRRCWVECFAEIDWKTRWRKNYGCWSKTMLQQRGIFSITVSSCLFMQTLSCCVLNRSDLLSDQGEKTLLYIAKRLVREFWRVRRVCGFLLRCCIDDNLDGL